LFGQLHPIGTIPAAFLFGGLLVGANSLQRAMQVPSALVGTLNGLVVVFVVSSEILKRRRARLQHSEPAAEAAAPPGAASARQAEPESPAEPQ